MAFDLRKCVVRVEGLDGYISGTGFVVGEDLAVTCAHVIAGKYIIAKPGERVRLTFCADEMMEAEVLVDGWHPEQDVSFLRLTEALPKGVFPAVLGPSTETNHHTFEALGYPQIGEYKELGAEGLIVRSVTNKQGKSALQLRSQEIALGMSGAPVLDVDINCVVGMVTEMYVPDETGKFRDAVFAIPTETLKDLRPELTLGVPSEVREYLKALRRYCDNSPYFALDSMGSRKTLDEIYTIPRLRKNKTQEDQDSEQQGYEEGQPKEIQRNEFCSIADVLRSGKSSILLLGEPGAGKSTLLRQLAKHAWDDPTKIGLETCYLPILVPLRHLAKNFDGPVETRLNRALTTELDLSQDLPLGFWTDWPTIVGANWLILLDGLDEVSDKHRPRLIQWIENLSRDIGKNRIILTSRLSGYKPDEWSELAFDDYDLLGLTLDQTMDLATHWLGEKATAFWEELKHIRADVLGINPLLLTIAAKVYLREKSLPERRSALYGRCIEIWLWEAEERDLENSLPEKLKDPVELHIGRLACLALDFIEQSYPTDLEALTSFVVKHLKEQEDFPPFLAEPQGKQFIKVMAQHSGVFIRQDDEYDFIHPTFAEYLAAWAIVQESKKEGKYDLKYVWEHAVSRWADEAWREVALFVLDLLSDDKQDVTPLIRHVLWKDKGIFFAGDTLVEKVKVDKSLRKLIINGLLTEVRSWRWDTSSETALSILSELAPSYPCVADKLLALARDRMLDDLRTRRAIVSTLGDLRRTKDLIELVHDARIDAELRGITAAVLSRLDQTAEALPVLQMLTQNKQAEAWVRRDAALALSELGYVDEAILTLRSLAEDKRVADWARIEAATILGELKQVDEAVSILLALAQDGTINANERTDAAIALSELGTTDKVIPLLLTLVRDEKVKSDVRCNIVDVLGKFGQVDELLSLARDISVAVRVRCAAVTELGKMEGVDDAVVTLQALAQDKSDDVRWNVAVTLGDHGWVDEAVSILLRLVNDERADRSLRMWTIFLLRSRRWGVDAVLKLAQDEAIAAWVRKDAAIALSELKEVGKAISILLGLAQDEAVAAEVRKAAAIALSELKEVSEATSILWSLAQDKATNPEIRKDAVVALGKLGQTDDAIAILQILAQDEEIDAYKRQDCIDALVELEQADSLLTLAQDERVDIEVRRYAATALGKCGWVDEVAPILLKLAQDEKIGIKKRRGIIYELWELGQTDRLLTLAQDKSANGEIRECAVTKLYRSGWVDEALPVLRSLARDRILDANVRMRAAVMLGELGQVDEAASFLLMLVRDEEIHLLSPWGGIKEIVDKLSVWGRIDDLLALVQDEKVKIEVREDAMVAVSKLEQGTEAIPVLLALAQNEEINVNIRIGAANALGKLGKIDEATHILLLLAESKSVRVRTAAAVALSELGQAEEAVPLLLALARDKVAAQKGHGDIVHALHKLGRDDDLLALAQDENVDTGVRTNAVRELKRTDDLLALGQNKKIQAEVRKDAAVRLNECGCSAEAIAILQVLIREEGVDSATREAIAEILSKLGQIDEAVSVLLELAQDQNVADWLRYKAAAKLNELGETDRTIPVLLALAEDETVDPTVRSKAAVALSELGRVDEAVRTLLQLARDEKIDYSECSDVANTLSKLGRLDDLLVLAWDINVDVTLRRAVVAALKELGRDDDLLALAQDRRAGAKIRQYAATCLCERKQVDVAVPILLALAKEKKVSCEVRMDTAATLREFGWIDEAVIIWLALARDKEMSAWMYGEILEVLGKLRRTDDLLTLVRDETVVVEIRLDAVAQLYKIDEDATILLALAQDEKIVAEIRAGVAIVLIGLKRFDEAAAILLALARDEKIEKRSDIVDVLANLRRTGDLLTLAQDKNVTVEVRLDAARRLYELDRVDEAVAILLALARDEKIEGRNGIIEMLGNLQRIDDLLTLAWDKNVATEMRLDAVDQLCKLERTNEASAILLTMTQDKAIDVDIRQSIVAALGELEQPDILATLAKDESVEGEVRQNAAETLSELGRVDDSVAILLALAQDKSIDAWVRWSIAVTLRKFGYTNEAISILLMLMRDTNIDARVGLDAAILLREFGHVDEATAILKSLAWNEKVVPWQLNQIFNTLIELGRADDLLMLVHDENVNAEVRTKVAIMLSKHGRIEETTSILLMLAQNKGMDNWIYWDMATRLRELGRVDEAVSILLMLVGDDKTNEYSCMLRADALTALIELGRSDEAVSILLRLARDEETPLGELDDVLDALVELGRTDDLLTLAQDKRVNAKVRKDIAIRVYEFGLVDEATPILLTLAGVDNFRWLVRDTEAAAIRSALVHGEGKDNVQMYQDAIIRLGELGCVEDLLALLQDTRMDLSQCQNTLEVILKYSEIDTLLALARNTQVDVNIRVSIATRVAQEQTDEAVPLLLRLLSHETIEAERRALAIVTLNELGYADEVAKYCHPIRQKTLTSSLDI